MQRFQPYKLQVLHYMAEDNPDRCMEWCYWFLSKQAKDAEFFPTALFSDEAVFYVNGYVNR